MLSELEDSDLCISYVDTYNPAVFRMRNLITGRVIEKKLKYRIHHPISAPSGPRDRLSPSRIIHDLGWMSAMVSRRDAREVFSRTFSRPFRLLLFNPVCSIFSLYYAYIYGEIPLSTIRRRGRCCFELRRTLACIYLFLVSIPLLFGSPPFARPGLFTYSWPMSTVSLAYLGMSKSPEVSLFTRLPAGLSPCLALLIPVSLRVRPRRYHCIDPTR